jgi:hypothetical protein
MQQPSAGAAKLKAAFAARDAIQPSIFIVAALLALAAYVFILGLLGFGLEAEKKQIERENRDRK